VVKIPAGYLNARQAAAYIGYEVAERDEHGTRLPSRDDKGMRAFYEFARRHPITKKHRGRCLLFRRADLDAAIEKSTEDHESKFDRMATLARKHAAGEDIHA
jgi:hypothetical protein